MKTALLGLASVAALMFSQGAGAVINCGSVEPYASAIVTALGGGEYQYVINLGGTGSPLCDFSPFTQVTDFYIPYFPDMGIDTASPDFSGTYFSYDIEADSIFGLGGKVLHYRFASGINAGIFQHVEFDASFGGVEAPFQSDLIDNNGNRTTFTGDPLIPGSPETLAALDASNAVSEPGAFAIFFSGLGLLLTASRKTRGRSREGVPPARGWTAAAA